MHAILVSVGTGGDIFPYVGVGKELRARGHRVTLVVPEDFAKLATEHDLDYRPLVSLAENHEILSNPDFWHWFKAARLAARWGMRFVERQYRLIAELAADDREAVIVSNPGVLASKMVGEKFGRPIANLILQPWMIPSSIAPPVVFGLHFPAWLPRSMVRLFWRFLDVFSDALIARDINRIRASQGLQPVRRILRNWLSRELVLGMFPEWYGPPQADWPGAIRLAGFPMFDGVADRELPPQLVEFCRSGKPPLVFTFGTGMMHAQELFKAAIGACEQMGVRAIFLSKHREQIPADLPGFVRHFEFAPLKELLPRCAALVHHGGVGTTASAMAAGIPQLILPFAFDQTDNGVRVRRLGVGDWLKQSRAAPKALATALSNVMTTEIRQACQSIAGRFKENDSLSVAADWIESISKSGCVRAEER